MLSIVVPIYNEYGNIPELSGRLHQVLEELGMPWELIWVDDASRDDSLSQLRALSDKDPRHRYISFSRNFGHQVAVSAGLDHASGDAVVIMDGDLQDPPELIPKLYEQWKRGYEVVYAQRVSRDGESYFKKASAFFFYRILKSMTRIPIPLDTGDFRLIDRKVVEALRLMPERRKFLRGQIAWTGYRSVAVPYKRDPRFQGKTNYSLGKMFRLAWDGISGFSAVPLKLVSVFGLMVALVAFALILYALWSHFVWGETVRGWTSLITVVLFLGGVQLLSIGIIGEYISRMDENIRQRPLYLLKESRLGENHDSGSTMAPSPRASSPD